MFYGLNTETEEGKLLIAAVGLLMTTEGRTDKTPEDIVDELKQITGKF